MAALSPGVRQYARDVVEPARKRFWPHLDGQLYFDAAAAPVYPAWLVDKHAEALRGSLISNPHSAHASTSAARSAALVERARALLLAHLDADPAEFVVVWTRNATDAIRLAGASLDWSNRRLFCHARAHTSLLGLRTFLGNASYLAADGAEWAALFDNVQSGDVVAWPAQCNASGERMPVAPWARIARDRGALTLLDAAALLASNCVSLRHDAPDMVACSLSKILGYPTSIGALIVRRSTAATHFIKKYFGGGAVLAVAVRHPWAVVRPMSDLPGCLEDGTLPFTELAAVPPLFEFVPLFYGSWERAGQYTLALAQYLYDLLAALRFPRTDTPIVRLHSYRPDPANPSRQGPVITLTVLDETNRPTSHHDVARLARAENVHLRTGAFCNMGALQSFLGITDDDVCDAAVSDAPRDRACWDESDTVNGKPSGAVRLSLALYNTTDDCDQLVAWFTRSFASGALELASSEMPKGSTLEKVMVYPVKSCRGVAVAKGQPWPIDPHGLRLDRCWAAQRLDTGALVTSKKCPSLLRLTVALDAERNDHIRVALDDESWTVGLQEVAEAEPTGKMCGRVLQVRACNGVNPLNNALSYLAGTECQLVQRAATTGNAAFSNESPFLLVNLASLDQLVAAAAEPGDPPGTTLKRTGRWLAAFRPNLVVRLPEAWLEDSSARIRIGTQTFTVLAPCVRCSVISQDLETGEPIHTDIYRALARVDSFRKSAGTATPVHSSMKFGVHVCHDPAASSSPFEVTCGDSVTAFEV